MKCRCHSDVQTLEFTVYLVTPSTSASIPPNDTFKVQTRNMVDRPHGCSNLAVCSHTVQVPSKSEYCVISSYLRLHVIRIMFVLGLLYISICFS